MTPDDPRESETRHPATAAASTPAGRRSGALVLAGVVLVLALVIGFEIYSRASAETELAQATQVAAVPIVTVIHPASGAPDEQLALPGSTQAFIDTPIYARTSGYLKKWYFDIGAPVKQGDLLAEIETPEVDQQLRQARADVTTAEANLKLAGITADRNITLFKTDSVSQQDRDNAVGALDADKAIVQSRQADVARLEQLQSYEKVFAPFDGVVTARNTDIGALIDAGASSPTRELFHMTATKTLRIFVAVPEIYARVAKSGAKAPITFEEYPGQSFAGTVARNSNTIDANSRTLNVEVDVDNAKGEIMPGAYGFVHFTLPQDARNVTVPANTLLFRAEGLQVGVVRDGKAQLVPVKIGRDYGDKVEIISGLDANDQVILDPSDSLVSDTPVQIKPPKQAAS